MRNTFSVLSGKISMRRSINVSDAAMYNIFLNDSAIQCESPVSVTQQNIRGKIIETAKLDPGSIGMRVKFGIKFINLKDGDPRYTAHNTTVSDRENVVNFRNSAYHFIDKAKKSNGIYNIALRYARNIANGRWLGSNLIIAENTMIRIKLGKDDDAESLIFQAHEIPLDEFDGYSADEKKVAQYIARCLKGECKGSINIEADLFSDVKGAIVVYPSQAVTREPGKFLYKHSVNTSQNLNHNNQDIIGYAAISDSAIRGALRIIDTWQHENKKAPKRIRLDNKNALSKCFLQLNNIHPETDQGLFVIANMVSGFLYEDLCV
ncbi:MAG: type I-F CRISPR-associated protein Cas7f/Csy3 [Methylobacter sp.]|uniref:type I-F CRISPR-associated protein Cas7f/Csy3 n=1 Tax=Methylobacter sp. TaxID=2051955 RepID=UPI0025876D51|nr:type I-F CRISPR-associated protein Cas7f/Csy3 [Methylobacter sp.]MCL7421781.1 type I-F CRISPR-associated protein Cas7f/Csy3 [Methylobacter sp.]